LSEFKPEKKVLKNALMKLKANVTSASAMYNEQIKSFSEFLNYTIRGMQGIKASGQDAQRISYVIMMLGTIGQQATQLIKGSLETINDWRTYTEVLENYSAELDSTLTKIFEEAEKISKEQIEKQKELIGKTPEYAR
jgi:septal ring factor EnvC (AmiA/AmiB activator)